MKSAINIESKVKIDKTAADTVGNVIDKIFKSANENRIDQSTIVEALKVLPTMIKVNPEHINISGCSVVSHGDDDNKCKD